MIAHRVGRVALACVCVLMAAPAAAACTARDSWRGDDKRQHLQAGAVIATAATIHTGSRWRGFAWGAGVGLAKEVLDAGGSGTCSWQDFIVTAAGAALGTQLGGVVLHLQRGRVGITYTTTF